VGIRVTQKFRVGFFVYLKISGFDNCYPKFARDNENPTLQVPENSGSGNTELLDFIKLIASRSKATRFPKQRDIKNSNLQ
jgi:hypothetical protein